MRSRLRSRSGKGKVKGRFTVLQLLKFVDDWTAQLDSGGQVDVIYTDFAKTYDTVPHERLFLKIKTYNIDTDLLLWITDFLCQRFSNWGPWTKGGPRRVPTGSARGFRKVVIVCTMHGF